MPRWRLPPLVEKARFERAEEVFDAALALRGEARARFIEHVCGTDMALRGEVESLLQVAAASPAFLDSPLIHGPVPDDPDLDDPEAREIALPFLVGPYRLVRAVGRGGMGRVYQAEQEGIGRHVAIKLLRPAMASSQFVRRFRAEQKILAGLEHPGVARLYDAGTAGDGTPYLAMEYVEGVDLLTYCTANRLNIPERLRLFVRVCEAVQYAHQHLIVHCDLKPSNILVTPAGEPKLLDFGIARLLPDEFNVAETGGTVTGLRLMTPEYASPEQVRGEQVTTASDVYSLGVILYELLSGQKPYRVAGRTPHEIERLILEAVPTRPSAAIAEEAAEGHAPAGPSSKRLAALLRGDLDNIALKALAKDRSRRYATAEELAEDARRHLGGLPVRARPDTLPYRTHKFLVRHRWAVGAGIATAASLLVALAITMNAVLDARRERDLSNRRFADVRRLANVFLFDVEQKIRDITGTTGARELLVSTGLGYLDRLAADAGNDPSLLRELASGYERLGDVQGSLTASNLGQSEAALASYQKASSLRQRLPPSAEQAVLLERARGEMKLAQGLLRVARLKEALPHSAAGADLFTQALTASNNAIDVGRERAEGLIAHGFVVAVNGDLEGSLQPLREAVGFYEDLPPAQLDDTRFGRGYAFAMFRLIQVLQEFPGPERRAEAVTLAPRIVAIDRRLLEDEPNRADLRRGLQRDLCQMADLLAGTGRREEAVPAYAECRQIGEEDIAADARDRQARRSLGVARVREAANLLALTRESDALARIEPALRDLTDLLAEDPKNVQLQVTFAEASTRFGDVAVAMARTGSDRSLLPRARPVLARASALLTPLVSSKVLIGEDAALLTQANLALAACDELMR